MRTLLLTGLLAVVLPVSADAKEPVGQIQDQEAFKAVHSFCVDSHALAGPEGRDLEKFIKRENKPQKLLGKLGWKFADTCSDADAIVKLSFTQRTVTEVDRLNLVRGPYAMGPAPENTSTLTKVTLMVVGKISGKPIYAVTGKEVKDSRSRAIESPFSNLQHDLTLVSSPE